MSDRTTNLMAFEETQQEIEKLVHTLTSYREGRRAVALAITKLEEARLWLGEQIMIEPDSSSE